MQQCSYCKRWFKSLKDLAGHFDTTDCLDVYWKKHKGQG